MLISHWKQQVLDACTLILYNSVGGDMAAEILATEIQFYEEHRESLASDHPGRFLLIRDSALHGSFDTLDAALEAGFSKFGSTPFLARRAGEDALQLSAPAMTIGVPLVADS